MDGSTGETMWTRGGSYLLLVSLARDVSIRIGTLGESRLASGIYAYVGSAKRGIGPRVDRHRRLARMKNGTPRWHIDYILTDPHTLLLDAIPFPSLDECALSRAIASGPGVDVPVPGFGSSDCTRGCRAHFYRLPAYAPPMRRNGAPVFRRPRRK